MSRIWTIAYLEELKRQGKIQGFVEKFKATEAKQRSKYGAQKTVLDGITFDSKREAKRYMELRMLLAAGEIRDLQLQVPFQLSVCKYVADFTYRDQSGNITVEDSKGFKTKDYRLKRKLMKHELGIDIKEV